MEPRTYKVTKIDGDYAHLLNVDTGEDLLMARALLPDETDEGTKSVTISIPEKHMHTPVEIVDINDIDNTALLIEEYLKRV